jgi:hypothetical protein
VIAGGAAEPLNGGAPDAIVAFRFKRTANGRHEKWTQVPVQVDERKLADFGSAGRDYVRYEFSSRRGRVQGDLWTRRRSQPGDLDDHTRLR